MMYFSLNIAREHRLVYQEAPKGDTSNKEDVKKTTDAAPSQSEQVDGQQQDSQQPLTPEQEAQQRQQDLQNGLQNAQTKETVTGKVTSKTRMAMNALQLGLNAKNIALGHLFSIPQSIGGAFIRGCLDFVTKLIENKFLDPAKTLQQLTEEKASLDQQITQLESGELDIENGDKSKVLAELKQKRVHIQQQMAAIQSVTLQMNQWLTENKLTGKVGFEFDGATMHLRQLPNDTENAFSKAVSELKSEGFPVSVTGKSGRGQVAKISVLDPVQLSQSLATAKQEMTQQQLADAQAEQGQQPGVLPGQQVPQNPGFTPPTPTGAQPGKIV